MSNISITIYYDNCFNVIVSHWNLSNHKHSQYASLFNIQKQKIFIILSYHYTFLFLYVHSRDNITLVIENVMNQHFLYPAFSYSWETTNLLKILVKKFVFIILILQLRLISLVVSNKQSHANPLRAVRCCFHILHAEVFPWYKKTYPSPPCSIILCIDMIYHIWCNIYYNKLHILASKLIITVCYKYKN